MVGPGGEKCDSCQRKLGSIPARPTRKKGFMTTKKYKKMLMSYGLDRDMAAVLCMGFSSVCSLYGGKQEEFRKRTDWNRC